MLFFISFFSPEAQEVLPGYYSGKCILKTNREIRFPVSLRINNDLKIEVLLNHSRCVQAVVLPGRNVMTCKEGLEAPARFWRNSDGELRGEFSLPNPQGKMLSYDFHGPKVESPPQIAKNTSIHESAHIFPGVKIESNSVIGRDTSIGNRSVVLSEAKLDDGGRIFSDCSIGKGAQIGKRATIYDNVTIGDHVHIGDQCSIGSHTIVDSGISIPESTSIPRCAKLENRNGEVFVSFRMDAELADLCWEDIATLLLQFEGQKATILNLEKQKAFIDSQFAAGELDKDIALKLTRYFRNGCFGNGRHRLSDCLQE